MNKPEVGDKVEYHSSSNWLVIAVQDDKDTQWSALAFDPEHEMPYYVFGLHSGFNWTPAYVNRLTRIFEESVKWYQDGLQ